MKSLLVKQENQGEAFSYEILWKEDFSGLGAEVKKLQLPAKKPASLQTVPLRNCIWSR